MSLNQQLGFLLGNPRGVKNQLRGGMELLGARLGGGLRAPPPDHPTVRSLRTLGYADLGEFYDPEMISRLHEAYLRASEDPKQKRARRTRWSSELAQPLASVPEVAGLIDARLRSLLGSYYRGPLEVYKVGMRSNFNAPAEVTAQREVYSNYWHVDDRPTSTVKLFVNLHEVRLGGGPFELVDLPETRRLVRRGRYRKRSVSLDEQLLSRPDALARLTGRPGHAMLAATACVLHHARLVEPGHRRDIATFTFRSSRRPLPEDWASDVQRAGRG